MRVKGINFVFVNVGGQVLSPSGSPLVLASVTITRLSDGSSQTVMTNQFGYYHFGNISVAETYVINVKGKRYSFPPHIVFVLDNMENLNFTAQRREVMESFCAKGAPD